MSKFQFKKKIYETKVYFFLLWYIFQSLLTTLKMWCVSTTVEKTKSKSEFIGSWIWGGGWGWIWLTEFDQQLSTDQQRSTLGTRWHDSRERLRENSRWGCCSVSWHIFSGVTLERHLDEIMFEKMIVGLCVLVGVEGLVWPVVYLC